MDLTVYMRAWRTAWLRDRQVIDALVDPSHAAPSLAFAAALAQWPGTWYWSDEADGRHVVLTRPLPRRGERWWLHALLLALTFVTTTAAGAALAGAGADDPVALLSGGPTDAVARAWLGGLAFSIPLIAILLAHELGHYLTALRYDLDVSPPYFIPMPYLALIGTMGAFIRLRTVLSDRRQLLDVGVAGPIAGFCVALPVFAIGLAQSHPMAHGSGLVARFSEGPVWLGGSLITNAVARVIVGRTTAIEASPLAVAGWIGMFVTMLNLLPMSQLDGGHVVYAATPRWHRAIAVTAWAVTLALATLWVGWAVWAVLVAIVSRGRLTHPPVLDSYRPLPPGRQLLAWAGVVLFVLTFMPAPFQL